MLYQTPYTPITHCCISIVIHEQACHISTSSNGSGRLVQRGLKPDDVGQLLGSDSKTLGINSTSSIQLWFAVHAAAKVTL